VLAIHPVSIAPHRPAPTRVVQGRPKTVVLEGPFQYSGFGTSFDISLRFHGVSVAGSIRLDAAMLQQLTFVDSILLITLFAIHLQYVVILDVKIHLNLRARNSVLYL
jgi:hypothetical protein